MKPVSVQCRDVSVAFGATEVLKKLSLEVAPGEFFALLGPSGSGKSTLLRVIAGFVPAEGSVLLGGVDVMRQAPWERNVGMVFQSYALWPHLSVWDNVAFGLVERRLDRASIRAKTEAALELVGLAGYGKRRPGELSGGQQQRVALARTIVIEPQVLLLDEPLSNLDRALRAQMRQELLALQRRLGITTLFVTHDQEEAMSTADRMAVLEQGVVQQVGAPAELYDRPVNPFVAGFVGTMNFVSADALTPSAKGRLAFRPHALRVQAVAKERDPALAWRTGTVESGEFVGEFTRYRVSLGGQTVAVDQPHHPGMEKLSPGTPVSVGFDLSQARSFPA